MMCVAAALAFPWHFLGISDDISELQGKQEGDESQEITLTIKEVFGV